MKVEVTHFPFNAMCNPYSLSMLFSRVLPLLLDYYCFLIEVYDAALSLVSHGTFSVFVVPTRVFQVVCLLHERNRGQPKLKGQIDRITTHFKLSMMTPGVRMFCSIGTSHCNSRNYLFRLAWTGLGIKSKIHNYYVLSVGTIIML